MDEFPNTNGYNMSYSWTQSYPSLNPVYSSNTVRDEMIRIECVDNIVQNQLTYPEAERIINTILNKTRGLSND